MRVYLKTFGCRANHYDSEAVRAMIRGSGHELADTPGNADFAIFNSCAVTSQAVADLRKSVRGVARLRPQIRSIVMGCAAGLTSAADGDNALAALPTVNSVVPGADLTAVAVALGLPAQAGLLRQTRQSGTRALLRIQDGCDEHCTFCATTLARGASRSRPMGELVEEAQLLALAHPEIVLTGIHIGSFGHDRGETLGQLLDLLVRRVPGVRFRLSSIEATELDSQLLELLTGDASRVCPHVHAPLQSGSDWVLKRMGRHWYTSHSYRRVVVALVRSRASVGLGADVIAGFPGETEDDHRRTLSLVDELPFTYLHVFPFSARPGTAAARLDLPVAPAVVQRRARELRAAGAQKASAYRDARAGGIADVIVLSGPAGEREGVTEDYLTVYPVDASAPRGARFSGRLHLQGNRLVATAV